MCIDYIKEMCEHDFMHSDRCKHGWQLGTVVHVVSYQPLKNLHGQLQLCRHESPDVSDWHLAFSQQGCLAWRIAEEDCKQRMSHRMQVNNMPTVAII